MMDVVVALAPTSGLTAGACAAVNVSRASVYRRRADLDRPRVAPRPRPGPRRALSAVERQTVLGLLRAPRFADQAPAEVYASLLDEGVYHCSIRTMYRILVANQEVRERRNQLRHPVYKKPELLAQAPNQVWSWDITKLMGPAKWTYFYLYVIIDIFSRRVVGWCVADRESATLFTALFNDAAAKHPAPPGQLTLHADRGAPMRAKTTALLLADLGAPMRAKTTALLLADLGVTKSHSRPHTSNDNPFSESHFKTMKYQPQFPQRFGCIQDAKAFCRSFFDWYNQEHHHAGIGGAALGRARGDERGDAGVVFSGRSELDLLRTKAAHDAQSRTRPRHAVVGEARPQADGVIRFCAISSIHPLFLGGALSSGATQTWSILMAVSSGTSWLRRR